MAAFAGASTQYLSTTANVITAVPFTVGFWFRLRAAAAVNRVLFSFSDTASTDNYFRLLMTGAEVVGIGAAAGGTEAFGTTGVVLTAGQWNFVVGRFISATNRRISLLQEAGVITAASNITSRTPASIDVGSIGAFLSTTATLPWDGDIAEFWYTNADIQSDGGVLQEPLMRQLAFGGPFSVPHIAKDIIEYRSLRKTLASSEDETGEVFHGAKGRKIWTNINGITRGAHPPLSSWYMRPAEMRRRELRLFSPAATVTAIRGIFSTMTYSLG